jgi:hypothetical protein
MRAFPIHITERYDGIQSLTWLGADCPVMKDCLQVNYMIASIDVELATCRVNDFFMQHYIVENDFVLINIWRYYDIRRFYIVYPTELDTSSKSNLKFKRLPVQVRGLQSRA